jgi:hypothetical protein
MGDNCSEKCLRRLHVAIIAEQRSDGLSIFVHPSKYVMPTASDGDSRFVHTP